MSFFSYSYLLADRYIGVDLADQALEHIARTELVELGCSVSNHLLNRLGPAYRRSQLLEQVLADSFRISLCLGADILLDWTERFVELSFEDCGLEILSSRLHEWRVESTAYRQTQRTARSRLLK